MSQSTVFITTAIDYVNSLPHLGTAYEKIGADVLARFYRLCGTKTRFLMGTDEHSLNVERKARATGKSPQQFCDEMSAGFVNTWKKLDISFDDFIRTTQQRHVDTVQDFFRKMHASGDVYVGKYQGWYCVSCEAFLREKDLADGVCPTHKTKPEWIEENNYFFRLSRYADRLLAHYEANPEFIQPASRRNEIVNVVRAGLEDISISRSSVGWGIPLPIDPKQVVYVWFDALINYVSGAGYGTDPEMLKTFWPADGGATVPVVHVIGKDITRFHCVIWPAMLMAVGLPLPQKVFGHGFVYLSGGKMSKSEGRIVDPAALSDKYGADAVRYFLMREIPFDTDGDFSWDKFMVRYNADLANDLGNLLNRVLNMIHRYRAGRLPAADAGDGDQRRIAALIESCAAAYAGQMAGLDFATALKGVWELVQAANKYVESTAPWKLAKDPAQAEKLSGVLRFLWESLRRIALFTFPFMPAASARIWRQLGIADPIEKAVFPAALETPQGLDGLAVQTPEVLFPKIEAESTDVG